MYKLALLIVMLMVVLASIGCQQPGLSEEEVRSIVEEEVTKQLAGIQVKDIVAQEVTKQLTMVDDIVGDEVTNQLASLDELTVSTLYIRDGDGKIVATLGSRDVGGYLQILSIDEELAALLCSMKGGSGMLWLLNEYKQPVIQAGCYTSGDGYLSILDKNGGLTFTAP